MNPSTELRGVLDRIAGRFRRVRLWSGLAVCWGVLAAVGLAAVVILLGLAVVGVTRIGGKKFGDAKWFRYLPVASALLLTVVGIWFLRDGFQMLSQR